MSASMESEAVTGPQKVGDLRADEPRACSRSLGAVAPIDQMGSQSAANWAAGALLGAGHGARSPGLHGWHFDHLLLMTGPRPQGWKAARTKGKNSDFTV